MLIPNIFPKQELSKEDYDQINELISLSKELLALYNRLAQFEKDDKKQTQEYKKVLDHLRALIEIENDLYCLISINPDKILSIINYFSNQYKETNNPSFVASIKDTQNETSMITLRIIKKLNNMAVNELHSLFSKISVAGINTKDKEKNLLLNLNQLLKITKSFEDDLVNIYINLICKEQRNDRNKENMVFKSTLVEIKYHMAFICDLNELLKNNFDSEDKVYLSYQLMLDYCNIPLDTIKPLKNQTTMDFTNANRRNYSNCYCLNKQEYDNFYLQENLLLRVGFIYNDQSYMNYMVERAKKDIGYSIIMKQDYKGLQIILDAANEATNDLKLIKILSLKEPK